MSRYPLAMTSGFPQEAMLVAANAAAVNAAAANMAAATAAVNAATAMAEVGADCFGFQLMVELLMLMDGLHPLGIFFSESDNPG